MLGATWALLVSFYLASQSDSICRMDHEQVAKSLRARLEKLEQTIVHADVKDHLLSFAKKNLDELGTLLDSARAEAYRGRNVAANRRASGAG